MARINHIATQRQSWTPSSRLFPQSTLLPQPQPSANSALAQAGQGQGAQLAGCSSVKGSIMSPRAPAGRGAGGLVGPCAPAFLLLRAVFGRGAPGSARQLLTGWQTLQLSGLFPSMISRDTHANPRT